MIRKNTIIPFAAVTIFATAALIAGPLNPPAGPVTSTYKTLNEVEPRIAINATNTPGDATSMFRITQPGSYYLTGNITGVAGKHGIAIVSSGVTLDLMGFEVAGVSGSLDGVSTTTAGLKNIAVVNGSVRGWGGDGIDLNTSQAIACRIEKILASGNGGTGFITGGGSTVSACVAFQNTSTGIVTLQGSTIIGCVAYQNTLNGINANTGCSILNCTAYDNTGAGISADVGTISNCTAHSNGSTGIQGINGCGVTGCLSYLNASHGISVLSGGTVMSCTARLNTGDGIRCTSNAIVTNNNCSSNGNGAGDGANIHVTTSDNRIEGNNCTGADRGIDVDVAGNIIIRNTCSGNTVNWNIVANNVCGPVLDRTAPASAAILGNSAPSSLGSTDPNANFTY